MFRLLTHRNLSFVLGLMLGTASGNLAVAATTDGEFSARGVGSLTCAALTELLGGQEAQLQNDLLASWIAGYVSHANRVTDGAFEVMAIQDNYGIGVLVANVCSGNPAVLVETAVAAVTTQMTDSTIDDMSEMVEVEVDSQRVVLRAETLVAVQKHLVDSGLLENDDADGSFGPKTRVALQSFQKSKGLSETGLPDFVTLFVLLGN